MSYTSDFISGVILQQLSWNGIAGIASVIFIPLTLRPAIDVEIWPEPTRANWVSFPVLSQLLVAAGFAASGFIAIVSTGPTALLAGSFGVFCLAINLVSTWSKRQVQPCLRLRFAQTISPHAPMDRTASRCWQARFLPLFKPRAASSAKAE
jgi:hypothetical protein